MTGGKKWVMAGVATLAIAACRTESGELTIRSIPSPLAAGEQPVSVRVAEGRAYFALNNIGLAIEAFRKAQREDPNSVDALNGLAASYDRMGRFDLSRRYYEQALALAPGDARLYANLATSLDMQGKAAEATSVRQEIRQRLAATAAPSTPTAPTGTIEMAAAIPPVQPSPVAAPVPVQGAPAASVTVTLAPPRSAAIPVAAASPVPAAATPVPQGRGSVTVALAPPRPADQPSRMHLERMSSGQVALVTRNSQPVRLAALPSRRSGPAPIMLLNAARHEGLAARTKLYLAQKGWRGIAIGDAPQVATRSVILYPAARKQQAIRLAGQFGFQLRHGPASADRLTILLGRDAAARRWLGARSG